jgi:hypothetical protein
MLTRNKASDLRVMAISILSQYTAFVAHAACPTSAGEDEKHEADDDLRSNITQRVSRPLRFRGHLRSDRGDYPASNQLPIDALTCDAKP